MRRLACWLMMVLMVAGCSRSAPQVPVGKPLAELDWKAAPAPVIDVAAAPVGKGPAPDLTDVNFATPDVGYAVTQSGRIELSEDGGATWRELYRLAGGRFYRIEVVDVKTAIAVAQTGCDPGPNCEGQSVLVRTADRGQTWQTVLPGVDSADVAKGFYRMRFTFPTADVGYLTPDPDENYGPLSLWAPLTTRDGGKTWRPLRLPEGLIFGGGISFLDADRGYVTARVQNGPGERILATRDGGRTWTSLYHGTEFPLHAVHFVTERDGYAAGGGNPKAEAQPRQVVLATHDGGATWQVVTQREDRGSPFTLLSFISPTEGWAAQGGCWSMGANGPCGGVLMFTRDGGRTWKQTAAYGTRIRNVGDKAWAIKSSNVTTLQITRDGGETWKSAWRPDAVRVSQFQFLSTQVGWIKTDLGTFKTADGGKSWAPYPTTGSTLPLFLTEQVALQAGDDRLLRSEDGGKTWQPVTLQLPPYASQRINHLSSAGALSVWAIRDRTDCPAKVECPELLFHSSDGGKTWAEAKGPGVRIRRVAFADEQHGVAVPWAGKLFLTADGGQTWTQQAFSTGVILNEATYAGGPDRLWLTGNVQESLGFMPGILLRSADGGQRWEAWKEKALGVVQLQFVTADVGWLSGGAAGTMGGGLLFNTQDGGRTWKQVWPALPGP